MTLIIPLDRQQIVIGLVLDEKRNSIIVSKRPGTSHQGGLWEFPGGKVEPYEDPYAALRRELYEELNIEVIQARLISCIEYDYPDLCISLDTWLVEKWTGAISGNEGQIVQWVALSELEDRKFPDANQLIIPRLRELLSISG